MKLARPCARLHTLLTSSGAAGDLLAGFHRYAWVKTARMMPVLPVHSGTQLLCQPDPVGMRPSVVDM